MGLGWMVGEDAVDRYVIKRIEDRFQNHWIRIVARTTLNPTRTYANIVRFKVPWYRDTRAGVYAYKPEIKYKPQDDIAGPRFRPDAWPDHAFELMANPIAMQYLGARGQTCVGGGGKAALRLDDVVSWVVDVDGCTLFHFPTNQSGDIFNYMTGLRFSAPKERGFIPFAEVLMGGTKADRQYVNVAEKRQLIQQAAQQHQDPPENGAYTTSVDANGVTMLVDGGVSYQRTAGVRFQLATLGYQRSWISQLEGANYNRDLRFSFGVAFRLGSWQR
jgi:hypothetical protein